jgi:signal transduction histidine kinase/DNA-binding response OmpR family regulator
MATILVVDDLSGNRALLVTLLRHQGHRLVEAADGHQALVAVHAERPDLVITDVLMPVMDGYEFVRQLRLDPATSDIPVVFSTAHYGEREARSLALSGGVSEVLPKPAESADVLMIVDRLLSGTSEARPPASAPLTPQFDREHLRLLTDKVSEKTTDLRTANARLRALVNISMELASQQDSETLLQHVCTAARDLFGATYVTLGILDHRDRTVQRFSTYPADAGVWIKTGDAISGILATVVTERRTLRGHNPDGDPARLQLPARHPAVQAFLAAPIASPRHVYGWICLVGNEQRTFSEEDEYMVLALAGQVGRIHENGHFYRLAKRRADELEQEILQRKQAEADVRDERDRAQRAEERMRFALESAGVGIWDMDCVTGAVQWSAILESQYGVAPGMFGGTFAAFVGRVHPDDRQSAVETLENAMKAGSDFSLLHRSIWPDGTEHWLSGAGRFHLGEHGQAVRGIGISLDATERRSLEEQFQHAQKMEAVGRLASGVAHDFNNVLTAILGYCELLLNDTPSDDPRHSDIALIHKAGITAASLTRQLLAFSRKQIIEPTLLDLNLVAAEMQSMVGRLLGEDVRIVLRPQPQPARVHADRGQMEQIIMNLALNARDAMPKGGTVTIETADVELDAHYAKRHRSAVAGSYVALTVTDTGTGITPQILLRLFEPFFTTKEVGKGTGLGLATVHGIVTRYGGSVDVSSEVGKGTSFTVYLPRATAVPPVVKPPPPVSLRPLGTHTVLVVEDEEVLRALAKRLLERQGYTVLVAASAEEAVQVFDRNASIDVLLTDVVMPGAAGPELTGRLVEQRPGLKVIYMSGHTEDAIVQHGVLKPGVAFLQKPFTTESLGRKIRELLDL